MSVLCFFFFFKQKTAYEIDCDWSSDVCSSDLGRQCLPLHPPSARASRHRLCRGPRHGFALRSEEHTSELQSQSNLVCRLLLEKKKKNINLTLLLHSIILPVLFVLVSLDLPYTI